MRNPERYHFKEQEAGEEILEVVRRHWFNIFWQFIPILAIAFALISLFTIFASSLLQVLSPAVLLFVGSFLFLALWMVASVIWVDYYLDVWIITNKRVVNVEQKGLFMREVSELRYNKIQDITTEVHGFLPTMLSFGDVYVQTAGLEPRFLFRSVPFPYKIKDQLVALQKRIRRKGLREVSQVLHETTNIGE